MKKTIIGIIAIIFLFPAVAAAVIPPTGCAADSMITYETAAGVLNIDYYLDNVLACSVQVPKSYATMTIKGGMVPLPNQTEINQEFLLNLSSIISFFAGVMALMGFIMGVKGGKMS